MKVNKLKNTSVAAAVAFGVSVLLYTLTFEGEITGFFRIGDALPVSPFVDKESVRIIEGEVGYDGQMFLTLALDPTLGTPGTIEALDNPKYRYRRIGYPVAGHILGMGKPSIIPYALVGVNVACIAGLVLIASMFQASGAPEAKRVPSPLWILAFPGVWVSLCLSTADLLGSFLFVAALLLCKLGRHVIAATFLCAACFTREPYLATAAALALYMLFRGRKRVAGCYLLCIVPPLVWLAFGNLHVQEGTTGARESLALPFAGIISKLGSVASEGLSIIGLFEGYCFFLLLATVMLVVIFILQTRKSVDCPHIAALPCFAILAISKMQILESHENYLRIFLDAWMLLWLVPCSKPLEYARIVVFLLSGIASIAYVLNYVIS